DVDPAEFPRDRADRRLHVLLVKGIAEPPMRPAAGLIQLRHRPVEPLFVVVDRDDDAALLCDDVGGGAADAARRRGDQRHLIVKSHPFPLSPAVLHRHAAATSSTGGADDATRDTQAWPGGAAM